MIKQPATGRDTCWRAGSEGRHKVIIGKPLAKSIMRRIGSNKLALVTALAAVVALGMTTSLTLGGFSAGITNSASTFSSATIQLEESNGTTTCYAPVAAAPVDRSMPPTPTPRARSTVSSGPWTRCPAGRRS